MPKVLFIILGILVLLPASVVVLAAWTMQGHAVDLDAYNEVEEGMSPDQVESLLGKPTSVNTTEDGTADWIYNQRTWCMVARHFSAKVKEI